MVLVRFENVGQNKLSWESELKDFDGQAIIKHLRETFGYTESPDVWYDRDEGRIYLYGYKLVGYFYRVPEKKLSTTEARENVLSAENITSP